MNIPNKVLTDLIRAGSMLSNCAFNMKQDTKLDSRYRISLEQSQKAWDDAILKVRIPKPRSKFKDKLALRL